ncbi:MAG: acyl-CoA synthetase FdrA [Solobacterium sp.]|nr:acyl-CoA synthetase FdrA [Solobacterium sp.]
MSKYTKVLKDSYFDSVTLMSLSAKVKKETGASEVTVLMATDMNKDLIAKVGLSTDEVVNAGTNDCVVAVECDGDAEEAVNAIVAELAAGSSAKKEKKEVTYHTQAQLYKDLSPNMVVISTPGRFAAREARVALENGKNVMMFSDNVTEEDEIALKKYAVERELLMMGPDCGTAIVNGAGLCFANDVRRGSIGIVGASGTGLQEVTVLIHKQGGGISQALGVGGRDLHSEVGGLMTMQCMKALNEDPATDTIVVVSKPPAADVEAKVIALAETLNKPVVLIFIDGSREGQEGNVTFCTRLSDGACKAVEITNGRLAVSFDLDPSVYETLAAETAKLAPGQKYLRALYCGGTLCSESLSIARNSLQNIRTNLARKDEEKLADPLVSEYNTIVDMGDDFFTNGKPHPMIEPSIRLDRIVQEANDPETAVILLDFELGYGSHDDPVGITIDAIKEAQATAEKNGRHIVFAAYICGTDQDRQNFAASRKLLEENGVIVTNTNEQAAILAVKAAEGVQ